MPKYCPDCGAKLETGDEFCPDCGAKIEPGVFSDGKKKKTSKKVEKTKELYSGKHFWFWILIGILFFFGVLFFISSARHTSVTKQMPAYKEEVVTRRLTNPNPRPIERATRELKSPACMDNYVDFGTEDEECHDLVGWASTNGEEKWMTLRAKQSVLMWIEDTYRPHVLSFKHYDGTCDDSFDVLVNGVTVYQFKHKQGNNIIATVKVPTNAVNTHKVTITFVNKATDNCGRAGIDWVKLEKA